AARPGRGERRFSAPFSDAGATVRSGPATREDAGEDATRVGAAGAPDIDFDGRRPAESRASLPVTTILFPVSSTVHELGHYVAARAMGFSAKLHIDRVTLDRGQTLTPRQSMVLSLAGPAANLVFAAALWLLAGTGVAPPGLPSLLLEVAVGVNVSMAAFNLIPMALPGFPLKTDGWQFGAAFRKWLRVRAAKGEGASRSALRKRDRRAAAGRSTHEDAQSRLDGVAASPEDAARVARAVRETLALEARYAAMSPRRLAASTTLLRRRLRAGEKLDALLPDAFAAARETMARVLGKRPYVEQVAAAAAIHHGRVVEQKTGEGKTLSIGLAAYLNALAGPVDVLTFNPYLAQRDAGEVGEVLEYLGMKIGFLGERDDAFLFDSDRNLERGGADPRLAAMARARVYREADVLYGHNAAFVFDYLRDQDAGADALQLSAGRRRAFAIVDEADANLLEEAQTDYRIVVAQESAPLPYEYLYALTAGWEPGVDFELAATGEVTLTPGGRARVESLRGLDESFARWPYLDAYAVNALKARHALHIDRDYAVVAGRAVILDPHTGYLLHGRNWEEGLHRFVEVKEGLWGAPDYRLASHIALDNFMRLYEKKSGITGTLGTSDAEFGEVYGLSAVRIPPHRPSLRRDLPDRLYAGEEAALAAAVDDALAAAAEGRPVLIGARDLAQSVRVAEALRLKGAAFELLNGVQARSEEDIVAEAGRPGRITVATQLAGRGTDVKLPAEALAKGGLHVVLTSRSTSLRVDLQYRGRAGRQGQPGSSRVFLSADDELFAAHATADERERLAALAARGEGRELTGADARLVDRVQERAEAGAAAGRAVSRLKDAALQPIRERYFRMRRELRERRVVGRTRLMDRLHADWVAFIAEYEDIWRRRTEVEEGVSARAQKRFEELVARPHRRLRGRWLPWRAAWAAGTVVPRFLNGWMFSLFVRPLLRGAWSVAAWVLARALSVPGAVLRAARLGFLARPVHAAIVALTPRDPAARLRSGRVSAAQGRYQEAVERFVEALSPEPARAPAAQAPRWLTGLTSAFERSLPARWARESRRKARLRTDAEAVRGLAWAYTGAARAARAQGQWLRAAAHLRVVADLAPAPWVDKDLSEVQRRLSPDEQALAATTLPELRHAYLHAARRAVDEEDFARADRLFARVVEADPSSAVAHYGRGFSRVKLGLPDAEVHLFRGLYHAILESRQFHFMRESYAKALSRSLSMADFDAAFKPGGRRVGYSRAVPGRDAEHTGWLGQQQYRRGNFAAAYRAFTASLRQEMFDADGRSRRVRIGHTAEFSWKATRGRESELFVALENLIEP
ncbi:MAG: hypothetical protein SF051_02000, partial [Elusimicrobiota bacterium]|nr:hypothetical protein [Elusimicrobiota bacterium]